MEHFLKVLNALGTVLLISSTASVVNRSVDTLVERMIAKHPNSRAWKVVDRILDVSDKGLQFLSDMLTKIIVKRNELPK